MDEAVQPEVDQPAASGQAVDPPRQVRLRVPAADTSVLRWLDLQHDIGLSVRMAIREAIEREGYVDLFNKPL